MSFQQDAFNLSFDDLYAKYPNRHQTVYRYKVSNYNTTLKKVIAHPRRNVLLILEDEVKLKAVQNVFSNNKTLISISSGQAAGASEGVNSQSNQVISGDLLPVDYLNEFYVYSKTQLAKKVVSLDNLFVDQLGASTIPELQDSLFGGDVKEKESKVNNVLTLTNLELKAAGTNFNILSYHDPEIDYFDGNQNITLALNGWLGEFGVSYLDDQDHRRQLEYELLEDASHAYAIIKGNPTRLKPEIVHAVDTYDENKNLPFSLARSFITTKGKYVALRNLWQDLGFLNDSNVKTTPAGALYWALMTIIYLSTRRLDEFQDEKIADKNSVNFQKLDTTLFKDKLYPVDVSDILDIDFKEFTARILKKWESNFAGDLDSNENLANLYQRVKGVLAALTEYIPSPFAFGNFDKIGRLAVEWYFIPKNMVISLEDVSDLNDFSVRLASVKYKFDESTKLITGLTDELKLISQPRNFNVDGQVSLPNIPQVFTEESKTTTAGAVDITNNAFLRYTWLFQLRDKSLFNQLFQETNPFIITGTFNNELTKEYTETIVKDGKSSENPTYNIPKILLDDIPTSNNIGSIKPGIYDVTVLKELEVYIQNVLSLNDRTVTPGSAKLEIKYGRTIKAIAGIFGTQIRAVELIFSWEETNNNKVKQVAPLKPPFQIDQAQWETFESSLGSSQSEFLLKPSIQQGTKNVRRINDIHFKSTLSNFATIKMTAVLKDGTTEPFEITFDLGFKRDQSQVQEGLYV